MFKNNKVVKILKITLIILILIIFAKNLVFKTENQLQIELLNKWQNNSLIKITNLTDKHYNSICVINPYASNIDNNKNSNEIIQMNNYLKKISYVGEEGNWAFVTSLDNNIEMFKFNRGEIDIFSSESNKKIKLPDNFLANKCVDFKNGFLYLFENEKRKYIILGELKQEK
jgi:predicted RND superfamily exporter protein